MAALPEIKHTRFFLTLIVLLGLFVAMAVDLTIMLMKLPTDQVTFGLLNVIVGALIAMSNTAFQAYFKGQEAKDAAIGAVA